MKNQWQNQIVYPKKGTTFVSLIFQKAWDPSTLAYTQIEDCNKIK